MAVALILLAGCDTTADPPVPSTGADGPGATPPTVFWRSVGTWSGTGDRQTESFDVTTGALRLVSEASGAPGEVTGRLRVTVHSAISGRPLRTVVDRTGPGKDTVLVAVSPRVAHLQIESEELDWSLTLQERAAPATGEDGR